MISRLRQAHFIILVGLLPLWVAAPIAQAGKVSDPYGLPDEYIEDPTASWREQPVTLPAYPRSEDLLAVPLPTRHTIKVHVDPATIAIGEDLVVRMTLVVESRGGARNVFYEGFRCATLQHKTYAYGAERQLKAMPNATWQDVPTFEANNYLRTIYIDYVCGSDVLPRARRDIVRRMTHGASSSFIGDD